MEVKLLESKWDGPKHEEQKIKKRFGQLNN